MTPRRCSLGTWKGMFCFRLRRGLAKLKREARGGKGKDLDDDGGGDAVCRRES
jgi:hypothetical protein